MQSSFTINKEALKQIDHINDQIEKGCGKENLYFMIAELKFHCSKSIYDGIFSCKFDGFIFQTATSKKEVEKQLQDCTDKLKKPKQFCQNYIDNVVTLVSLLWLKYKFYN